MKIKTFSLLAVAATLTFSVNSSAYQFTAGDKTVETQLCISVAKDNLKQLKNGVNDLFSQKTIARQGHTVVANKLKCNNTNIIKFARQYGANETARFLAQFLEGQVDVRRTDISANERSNNEVFEAGAHMIVTASF